ncbi:uncharacterized protein J8A68_005267 [[Candida] subhashii]|uniref:Pre-mRNA-processing factor 19 n=1 Tax=[Candida] subhashii TaxID=561895 RepID=A0A8J5QHE5_9ASCO|nr:uncharacterized protein J8A68_005267 [[Candida] subhashii]KAG7661271.1 hypothetical protein J8A68_005267 [[Candida] subhashii]
MICSISGERTTNPVVSPKSGAIFERKHIENYISTSGTDPITNDPLSIPELIPLKPASNPTIIPPNPTTSTSIPSLLASFQNEWDSVVLEMFTLRKQLAKAREELSNALYRQDAAIRVAAKAMKERDQVKKELEKVVTSLTVNKNSNEEQEIPPTINDKHTDILTLISQARDELFQIHKSRKIKLPFTADDELILSKGQTYFIDLKTKPKPNDSSAPQWCLDPFNKRVAIDLSDNKILKSELLSKKPAKGKRKQDNIWQAASLTQASTFGKNGLLAVISGNELLFDNGPWIDLGSNGHNVLAHPKLDIFIVDTDESWLICNTEQILIERKFEPKQEKIRIQDIHGDGEIIAAIQSGKVCLYSIITGLKLATFEPKYENVIDVKFGANGYWLYVLSQTKDMTKVEIFDLRSGTKANELDFKSGEETSFIIDVGSNTIFTVYNQGKYTISRYNKKSKKWNQNELKDFPEEFASQTLRVLTTPDELSQGKDVILIGLNDVDYNFETYVLSK